MAETGMSGSVCHHTRECGGTLIPVHLSFSTWSCEADIVIGDRVELRGQLEKWMEEVMSKDVIIILIKMYRAHI